MTSDLWMSEVLWGELAEIGQELLYLDYQDCTPSQNEATNCSTLTSQPDCRPAARQPKAESGVRRPTRSELWMSHTDSR